MVTTTNILVASMLPCLLSLKYKNGYSYHYRLWSDMIKVVLLFSAYRERQNKVYTPISFNI